MVLYENRLSIKWKWVCISAYLLYILILNLYVFEFKHIFHIIVRVIPIVKHYMTD